MAAFRLPSSAFRFLFVFLSLACLAGCDGLSPAAAPVDLPIGVRGENYTVRRGWRDEGSCLHVACQNCLRQAGLDAEADQWRKNYGGGITFDAAERIGRSLGLWVWRTESAGSRLFARVYRGRPLRRDLLVGAGQLWPADLPRNHLLPFRRRLRRAAGRQHARDHADGSDGIRRHVAAVGRRGDLLRRA